MNLSIASSQLLLLVISGHQQLVPSQAVLLRGQEKEGTKTTQTNRRALKGGKWDSNNNSGGCIIDGEKIGIYTGGGVCTTCVKWAEALAAFWQTGMRGPAGSGSEGTKLNHDSTTFAGDGSATYVTLTTNQLEDCYNGELDALSLLMMPGGSAYSIQDTLGSAGKVAIRNYLDNGGNYLGFCAGGYYMASGYYWSGELYFAEAHFCVPRLRSFQSYIC